MENEQVREAFTPEEMRAELYRLSHYDYLVRRAMDTADIGGMSAEDRYTILAYYAMLDRNKFQKMITDYMLTTPAKVTLYD